MSPFELFLAALFMMQVANDALFNQAKTEQHQNTHVWCNDGATTKCRYIWESNDETEAEAYILNSYIIG